jgi:hypothetical protein
MQQTANKIAPFPSVIDETFDASKSPEQYSLLIDVAGNAFSYAVYDKPRNKFIVYEKYLLPVSQENVGTFLSQIYTQNSRLAGTYASVSLSFASQKFTLTPNVLFDKDRAASLLGFNNELDADGQVLFNKSRNDDYTCIFSVPGGFYRTVSALFPQAKWLMACTPIIEYMLLNNKNTTGKKMFFFLEKDYFFLCVTEGRKLLLFNRYTHTNAEDFIYFLLFVCNELSINTEEMELLLGGEIERRSPYFELALQYIKDVKICPRPAMFTFSYGFDKISTQAGFNLFTQLLCV